MLKNLLNKALEEQASDIHIKSNYGTYLRINNELIKQNIIFSNLETLNIANMLNSKITNYNTEQDFSSNYLKINLRCNLYQTSNSNYNLAIRILNNKPKSLNELGLPAKKIEHILDNKYGLILISGATGHGKTTTLASLIELINTNYNYHIITIEDPIEYRFNSNKSLIDQREVGIDTESFVKALRAALRQDPDVIVIGELRDIETIRTAIWAAETGHLVLATIHAGDALETIDKLVQYFPNEQTIIRYSLANSLKAIISQRLYISKTYNKKICLCDLLINNLLIKKFIKENDLQSIKNEMESNVNMILRDKSEKEYKHLGII